MRSSTIAVTLLAFLLVPTEAHAWFFFIPGKLIDSVSDEGAGGYPLCVRLGKT